MRRFGQAALAALITFAGTPALAQDIATEAASDAFPPVEILIPKLTPVMLEILSPLGSKTSTSFDRFQIRLADPIFIDGMEVLPAGAMGEGEVVHAKKAGGMGTAGELVLAARYIGFGERRLALRSMSLSAAGKDAVGAVDGLNAVGAGISTFVPVPIGLVGFVISGRNIAIPAGTVAMAKTAEDFTVPISDPLSGAGEDADKPSSVSMAENLTKGED
ncbi:hypothetical protein GRI89_03420 [Altererythrobacter salegens]|uniref:Uncharacterized protein n=1 Tax=Croceibacterium salegens TaxID=1737568 RepID=A0A6I4SW74_9SPHN|nr:hypothetical protein [Croceibacterium salegens]MXO58592.1 hypothetical protein [Croceibacterium salegens]